MHAFTAAYSRAGKLARFRHPDHCREAALDILIRGCPAGDADPHRGTSMPLCSTAPAGAIILHIRNHAASLIRTTKGHEHLVEHDLIQHLESCLFETLTEDSGSVHRSLPPWLESRCH